MPTFTIVVPAYNASEFVTATLESALNQTFSDFEVIVVDDGSTDETAARVQEFVRRDSRIRLIHQSNGGIAAARNAALADGTGEFFALLDSDDIWFPDCLAQLLDVLRRRPEIDVLSANCLNMGGREDGKPLRPVGQDRVIDLTLLDLIRFEDSVCILSAFRRTLVDAIGSFDSALGSSEDYDYWLRAAAAGFGISFSPTPLGQYRRRPDSVSANLRVMIASIEQCLHKLRASCEDRPEITEAIDRKLVALKQRVLLESAKQALARRDHVALTADLAALHRLTGAWHHATAAWLSRTAPSAIAWAYALKRASRWMVRSRPALPKEERVHALR